MAKAKSISRRTFLGYAGGMTAGAAVIGSGGRFWGGLFKSEADLVEPTGVGLQDFKVTLCGGCDGGCSLVVRLIDGRAVGIRGNPLYPVNRGHACPKGAARLQHLYNPDRVRTPLRRGRHRGEDNWVAISWDEALDALSNRISTLRSSRHPERAAILAGSIDGIDADLARRFLTAYGSPNFVAARPGDIVTEAVRNLYGDVHTVGYDLENCNYLICFGDWLGTGPSPVWTQGAFGYLRQGRGGIRTKIVQVGSRINLTAANADEWVNTRPGGEGALALGIAHLLIQQDLYDHEFVDNHTHGFDKWSRDGRTFAGFRDHVLKNYPPRRVSEISGVPIHIISRLASELARNRPALAVGWYESASTTNSYYNIMAIEALNALIGSIDAPGGVIRQKSAPLEDWTPVQPDALAADSLKAPRLDNQVPSLPYRESGNSQAFLEGMAEGEPYPVELLIVCGANPIHEEWGGKGYNRSYDQVGFIVALTPFMDDTARYADLVLPTNVDFESWGYGNTVSGTSIASHLALRQPVVDRVHDTRQSGDIFIQLAERLGGNIADSMLWRDTREALYSRLYGIADSNTGMISVGSQEKDWLRSLARLGWRSPGFSGRKDFVSELADKGGWWDPLTDFGIWKKRFATPSGKFEFASLKMLESFKATFRGNGNPLDAARSRYELEGSNDEIISPHYEPPEFEGGEARYPLVLIPYQTVGIGDGSGANQPLMMEFIDPLYTTTWENVIELHHDTARSFGVENGDEAWVESPHGRLRCRVRVNPVNRPDAACIALGLGHDSFGRYANGKGSNPKALLAKKFDRISGDAALVATRVKVVGA